MLRCAPGFSQETSSGWCSLSDSEAQPQGRQHASGPSVSLHSGAAGKRRQGSCTSPTEHSGAMELGLGVWAAGQGVPCGNKLVSRSEAGVWSMQTRIHVGHLLFGSCMNPYVEITNTSTQFSERAEHPHQDFPCGSAQAECYSGSQ